MKIGKSSFVASGSLIDGMGNALHNFRRMHNNFKDFCHNMKPKTCRVLAGLSQRIHNTGLIVQLQGKILKNKAINAGKNAGKYVGDSFNDVLNPNVKGSVTRPLAYAGSFVHATGTVLGELGSNIAKTARQRIEATTRESRRNGNSKK